MNSQRAHHLSQGDIQAAPLQRGSPSSSPPSLSFLERLELHGATLPTWKRSHQVSVNPMGSKLYNYAPSNSFCCVSCGACICAQALEMSSCLCCLHKEHTRASPSLFTVPLLLIGLSSSSSSSQSFLGRLSLKPSL